MIKDTDGHLGTRDVQGKVCEQGHGASMPCLGMTLSPHLYVLPNPEAPCAPHYWDFMKPSSHRRDQFLTPFSVPLLSLKKGGGCGAKNPKLLITAWPFCGPREWLKMHAGCCRAHLQSLALGPLSGPHCTGHQIPQALRDVYFCAL